MENHHEASIGKQIRVNLEDFNSSTSRVLSELSALAESHLELFGEEINEQKNESIAGLSSAVAGTFAGIIATLFLSVTIVYSLIVYANLPVVAALALMTIIWLGASLILVSKGMKKLKNVHFTPKETIQSLKESIKCLHH